MARKMTVIEPSVAKPIQKVRVAAYCRVSSDKSEQTNSYAVQKMYFMKLFASSTTETLVDIYADIGSGTSSIYRSEFLRLLDDCRHHKIDRIVTKSLSRFARNTKECLKTLRELKSLNVTVAFEKEGIDTARVSDEIMITIMEGLAQEEAASISRNVRWSLNRRMASGTLGIARVPYGYIKDDSGNLIIDEQKAAIVRRIFSLYLSGNGVRRIAVLFTEEKIPSPTGIAWNNCTILKILKQEKYIGDIRWQKTYSVFMGKKWMINRGDVESYYIRDALPAIIDRETFLAAQALRERNTRKAMKTTESPFRGKTKCTCGRSYMITQKGRKMFWECSGKYDLQKPCENPIFLDSDYRHAWERLCIKLRKHADEIVLPAIEQCEILEDKFMSSEVTALEEQYGELSSRKYVLSSLCANGCITREKLVTAEAEIQAEMQQITDTLEKLNDQYDDTVDQLETLYKMLCKMKAEQLVRSALIKAVADGKIVEFELIGGLKFKETIA